MEINIENAFIIILKLSLGTFSTSIDTIYEKVMEASSRLAVNLLKRPLLSTLLMTVITMVMLCIISISLISLAATFCIVATILILECFIFGVIVMLAVVLTQVAIGIIIITQGIHSTYYVKNIRLQ